MRTANPCLRRELPLTCACIEQSSHHAADMGATRGPSDGMQLVREMSFPSPRLSWAFPYFVVFLLLLLVTCTSPLIMPPPKLAPRISWRFAHVGEVHLALQSNGFNAHNIVPAFGKECTKAVGLAQATRRLPIHVIQKLPASLFSAYPSGIKMMTRAVQRYICKSRPRTLLLQNLSAIEVIL